MRLEPFDYQVKGIDELREAFANGKRRGILCMIPGAGKTIAALELMRLSAEKGRRSLFLCDRRMLADQAVEVAREQGLQAGLLMARRGWDLEAPCQFASKQSIASWFKRGKLVLEPPDLVITDEFHRGISKSFLALYEMWPKAYFVGLTATPCLGNGNGMGAYADVLVQPISPSQLKDRGRIVPCRAYAPSMPNLKGVKKDKDGDYSALSLSERLNRANLVGDVVGWWKKLADGLPSIYFACDQSHALAIRDEFRANDVRAEMIIDETTDDERAAIKEAHRRGDVKVIVNVDVMSEGIDIPWAGCIGLVRPTKRLRRFLQSAGRGARADNNGDFERIVGRPKTEYILIDHAGCVVYHGFPDIDREWPLSSNDNVDKINQAKPKDKKTMTCVKCRFVFSGTNVCPECGHVHKIERVAKEQANKPGVLVEVTRDDLPPETKKLLMQRYWGTCIGVAIKRNRKAGMAAGMFSQKFGIPPWQAKVTPLPDGRGAWQAPARDVFPGFVRGQKQSRGDAYEDAMFEDSYEEVTL